MFINYGIILVHVVKLLQCCESRAFWIKILFLYLLFMFFEEFENLFEKNDGRINSIS